MTAIKAIRLKCLDCCCDQVKEVAQCPVTECSLWEFRMGKNPNYKKREFTEEQKEEFKARLQKARTKSKEISEEESEVK